MTIRLRRVQFALLTGLLPLACSAPRLSMPSQVPRVTEGGMCRFGPGGAPPDMSNQAQIEPPGPVDQGIGGTGAPLRHLADTVPIDQGVGGTGLAPAGEVQRSGPTGGRLGVVGVITGFGSVCVDGLEIAYDPATSVTLDDVPATFGALRVGQVVALDASGGPAPQASSVAVRHEVSGPVERLEPGLAVIAGQRVYLSDPVWGVEALRPGAWVAVSGLRDGLGVIHATRVDPRRPGQVRVRGHLVPGVPLRIGGLTVRASSPSLDAGIRSDPKGIVEVTGRYVDGRLLADSVVPDLLARDPVSYFGAGVERYVVEAYTTADPDGLRTGDGLRAAYQGPDAFSGGRRRIIAMTRDVKRTGLVATGITNVAPSSGQAGAPAGGARPAAGPSTPSGGPGPQGGVGGTTRAGPPGGETQALAPAPMPGSSVVPRAGEMGGAFGGGGPPPGGAAPRGFPPTGTPTFPGGPGFSQGGQGFGGGGRSGGR